MAAVRREIAAVEQELAEAEKIYAERSERLRVVTQERLNTEESLENANVKLKSLLGDLDRARAEAAAVSGEVQADQPITMGDITRKIELNLTQVLEQRFSDPELTASLTDAVAGQVSDRVRVEFDGDEVFWSLQDNYTFDMLLEDAARYWDISSQDSTLVDERGAIWPNDCRLQHSGSNPALIAPGWHVACSTCSTCSVRSPLPALLLHALTSPLLENRLARVNSLRRHRGCAQPLFAHHAQAQACRRRRRGGPRCL